MDGWTIFFLGALVGFTLAGFGIIACAIGWAYSQSLPTTPLIYPPQDQGPNPYNE